MNTETNDMRVALDVPPPSLHPHMLIPLNKESLMPVNSRPQDLTYLRFSLKGTLSTSVAQYDGNRLNLSSYTILLLLLPTVQFICV